MFKSIYIEITNICNLNCSFCKGTKRTKAYMTKERFKEVLEKIKNHTQYINLHILGEPLMHPDIASILNIANEYNMKVNLTTNGRLLKNKLDVINDSISIRQINISLHSFDNVDDIKELLELIDKITSDCYISFRLWNLGVNNNNDKIIKYLNEHYKTNINGENKSFKLKEKVYLNFDYQFEWPDIDNEGQNEIGTCQGLRTHIGILVSGTVVPCCLDTDGIIDLGNIFDSDLESILKGERCNRIKEGFLNKKLVEPLCKRCSYISRFDK